jgi:hypothetical protein
MVARVMSEKVVSLAVFIQQQTKLKGGRVTEAEGLRLLKAFLRIKDRTRRAAVIAMVENAARESESRG